MSKKFLFDWSKFGLNPNDINIVMLFYNIRDVTSQGTSYKTYIILGF